MATAIVGLAGGAFVPVDVQVVNEWARGTRANYGLSLFPLNGGTGAVAAATGEYATAASHRKLRLWWTC
jgi:hypothetical protein